MAKNTMTRAQALIAAIDLLEADHQADAANVLRKMHESITKPRTGTGAPSKARQRNERLAAEILTAMPDGKALTGAEIGGLVSGLNTDAATGKVSAQHVTAVMRILVDAGKVTKAKEGKRMTYTKA